MVNSSFYLLEVGERSAYPPFFDERHPQFFGGIFRQVFGFFLVPTNKTTFLSLPNFLANSMAESRLFFVFSKSKISTPFLNPKIYGFIFGFRLVCEYPKCIPLRYISLIAESTWGKRISFCSVFSFPTLWSGPRPASGLFFFCD